MPGLFENTVSAICYDIARTQPECRPPYDDLSAFILAQWARMPRFLAWPLRAATLAFSLASLLTDGALYYRLAPERRTLRLERWRLSRLGPCRDLVRFYHSLALLALYSRPAEAPAPVQTQDLMQLRREIEVLR